MRNEKGEVRNKRSRTSPLSTFIFVVFWNPRLGEVKEKRWEVEIFIPIFGFGIFVFSAVMALWASWDSGPNSNFQDPKRLLKQAKAGMAIGVVIMIMSAFLLV